LLELGSGPDLFHVSDMHIRALESYGKLDMLKRCKPDGLDPQEHSYPVVFDMFRIRGELRAVPFAFSPVVTVCNEKLWADSGVDATRPLENWQDLVDIALQCTKRDKDGMIEQYGFCFSTMMQRWQIFVLQNEGQLVSKGGKKATFSSKRSVEALQFCVDLIYKHKVSPVFSEGIPKFAEKLFAEGSAAMILTTYYYMNQFRDHKIQWKVLPAFGQKRPATLLMGSGLAVNSRSSKAHLAEQLLDYMTGTEAQTLLKRNGCTIPMLKSVAEDDALLDPHIHPHNYNMFRDILPYAVTLWDMGLKTTQLVTMSNELHYAWVGIKKPQQVCEQIDELLNEAVLSGG
jgi:multiple sugar transport system substrate-binding protein